jgi:hypothetical protein
VARGGLAFDCQHTWAHSKEVRRSPHSATDAERQLQRNVFGAKQVCANWHRWSRVLAALLAVSVSRCSPRLRAGKSACTFRRWIGARAQAARLQVLRPCVGVRGLRTCAGAGNSRPRQNPQQLRRACAHPLPNIQTETPAYSATAYSATLRCTLEFLGVQKEGHARTATLPTSSATHLSVCSFNRCFSSHHRFVERHDGRFVSREDMAVTPRRLSAPEMQNMQPLHDQNWGGLALMV